MENIYNILDEILVALKGSSIEKNTFYRHLEILNDLIKEKIGEIKMDHSKLESLLVKTNEERIVELDNKLSMLENCTDFLPEAVSLGQDKLRLFLKKYNIGFLRNLELTDGGIFKAEIGALITKHNSFHDKTSSSKLELDYQINELKKIGLDIDKSTIGNHQTILATQNSIDKLNDLLENIGARGIEISIRNYKGQKSIKSISFRIAPADLFKYNDTFYEVSYNVNDILNEDEIPELIYNIKELKSALDSLLCEELKEVHLCCKNIVLHTFSKMCEILNFETEISKIVKKSYEKAKIEASIIREREEMIKEKIDPANIKPSIEKILKTLELFGAEQINFIPTNVRIKSELKVDFLFNKCGYPNYIYNETIDEITEEKVKALFACSDGSFDTEDLLILNTEENINRLNSILLNAYGAKIESVDVSYRNFIGYYINKISVNFPSLTMF